VKEQALADGATAVGNAGAALFHHLSAIKHFAAAKMYGALAGGAAIAGGALAATSGGGGGGGGGSQEQQRKPTEIQINRGDITGQIGGEQQGVFGQFVTAVQRQLEATERLNDRLDIASPGDVLTRGVDQRPEAIARGVRTSLASDAGFIRDVGLAVERG